MCEGGGEIRYTCGRVREGDTLYLWACEEWGYVISVGVSGYTVFTPYMVNECSCGISVYMYGNYM